MPGERARAGVTELREEAERAATQAAAAIEKADREYADLTPANYERLVAKATEELAAAKNEAKRLREQEAALLAIPDLPEQIAALRERLLAPARSAATTKNCAPNCSPLLALRASAAARDVGEGIEWSTSSPRGGLGRIPTFTAGEYVFCALP